MNGRIEREVETNNLPVIGKIKTGEKTEKGYPRSLDYFIGYGKYKSHFDKAFPEKPNKIPIIFISDDIDRVCNERYELRNSKGDLVAKGDGKVFQVFNDKTNAYETFHKFEHPEIMKKVSAKVGTNWQVVLTLRFIVPSIKGILGLWQFETKGEKSSIPQIRDAFDYVQFKAGTVTRIMFDLTVTKHKSQKPGNPSSYPVISLIPNVSEDNLNILKEYKDSGKLEGVNYLSDETIEQIENKPKMLEAKKPEDKSTTLFNDNFDHLQKQVEKIKGCTFFKEVDEAYKEMIKGLSVPERQYLLDIAAGQKEFIREVETGADA